MGTLLAANNIITSILKRQVSAEKRLYDTGVIMNTADTPLKEPNLRAQGQSKQFLNRVLIDLLIVVTVKDSHFATLSTFCYPYFRLLPSGGTGVRIYFLLADF